MKSKLLLLLVAPLFSFGQWAQIGTDIDGEAVADNSGFTISLSGDGNVVAIGAGLNDGNGVDAGHVRVYENLAGVWTQIGNDLDGEAVGDHYSNESLSLSGDGTVLAIGTNENDGNGTNSGHVRVFENIAGVWTQIGIDIDGDASGAELGLSVNLSNDGNILAIGNTVNSGGQMRVYENLAGVWTQIGADINGEAAGDHFGESVSLSSDGSVVAIGATQNDGNGINSGHVRVFENIAGVWTQIGIDIDGADMSFFSGLQVSLNNDGNILAIGNIGGSPNFSGQVRVYENIAGVWTQIGSNIDAEGLGDSAQRPSLSGDGTVLAIGAHQNDGNGSNSGHVRVYENLAGVWTQIGIDLDGEATDDFSGFSVSISNDGSVVAIGAAGNDGNGANSGHVRVYQNPLLSITTNNLASRLRILPNPSYGTTHIELGGLYQEIKIIVFDLLGKEMMRKSYNNVNVVKLDTHYYVSGIYIIRIESYSNIANLKLIVK